MPPASLPGGVRADLTLSGRVDNPSLAGRVDATLPALDRLRGGCDQPNLKPSGALSLSATVSGTARAPAIDGRLVGEALSIAGQHADRLDASFGLNAAGGARRTARADASRRTALTANGRYDLRTSEVTAPPGGQQPDW